MREALSRSASTEISITFTRSFASDALTASPIARTFAVVIGQISWHEVKKLVSLRRTQDALINGGLRWVKAENDYVVYLRESKKQSILVLVSRGAIDATLDLSEYGYSISKTLYGEKVQGQSFRITSEGAIQGIWIVTR